MQLKPGTICRITKAKSKYLVPSGVVACEPNSGQKYDSETYIPKKLVDMDILVCRKVFEIYLDGANIVTFDLKPGYGCPFAAEVTITFSVIEPLNLYQRKMPERGVLLCTDLIPELSRLLRQCLQRLAGEFSHEELAIGGTAKTVAEGKLINSLKEYFKDDGIQPQKVTIVSVAKFEEDKILEEAILQIERDIRIKKLTYEIDEHKLLQEKARELGKGEWNCLPKLLEQFASLAELQPAWDILCKLALLPEHMVGKLASREKVFQTAERLVSPEFGFRPEELASLGYPVVSQMLVGRILKKASADNKQIVLQMKELRKYSVRCLRVDSGRVRDIGTARVKRLSVNRSLQFEFTTKRAGYVTLLNIGTSSSVYLHVPNAYVEPRQAQVSPGTSYLVPGSELLPWQQLQEHNLDYVEIGPSGWEHIAVFVSDEPLIKSSDLYQATVLEPFVKLCDNELQRFCDTLEHRNGKKWSAAVLSFIVVEE